MRRFFFYFTVLQVGEGAGKFDLAESEQTSESMSSHMSLSEIESANAEVVEANLLRPSIIDSKGPVESKSERFKRELSLKDSNAPSKHLIGQSNAGRQRIRSASVSSLSTSPIKGRSIIGRRSATWPSEIQDDMVPDFERGKSGRRHSLTPRGSQTDTSSHLSKIASPAESGPNGSGTSSAESTVKETKHAALVSEAVLILQLALKMMYERKYIQLRTAETLKKLKDTLDYVKSFERAAEGEIEKSKAEWSKAVKKANFLNPPDHREL